MINCGITEHNNFNAALVKEEPVNDPISADFINIHNSEAIAVFKYDISPEGYERVMEFVSSHTNELCDHHNII
jgi:hypothetical protein